MKKLKKTMAFIAVAGGLAAQSQAALYDISFTGNNSAGSGQIDVEGGLATTGFFDVFAGANQGVYNLVGVTSPLINGAGLTLVIPGAPPNPGGGDEIFDDVVNPGSNPFLTGNGLEFANSDLVGFNLWANGPGNYSLFDVGNGAYNIDGGIASIAVAPESRWTTTSAAFAAMGMLGLIAVRRKFAKAG